MKKLRSFPNIFFPVGLALAALLLSYLSTNLNIALSGEKTVLKYWCAFADWITSGREHETEDDVVFVNVSYDRQLVDLTDEFGIPLGNAAVTDRGKLQQFLRMIDESGTYRYVMLDVFFEEGYATESDSCLFSRIAGMDRIVIPRHIGGTLADPRLDGKAAYADYANSINENDFTKYRLFRKDGPSMSLKGYEDLTGRSVRRRLFWYADGWALARKVIFPKMYVRTSSPYRADGEKAYLNLGADILTYAAEIDWAAYFKDKIIVVGAFTDDDIHTTYAGDIPGCLINYNVFLSLTKGRHKIPLGLVVFYFLLFFSMAYLLFCADSGIPQARTWFWGRLFVLYSLVLTTVCIVVFAIWGQAQDIFITSTFFSTVNWLHHRIKSKTTRYA